MDILINHEVLRQFASCLEHGRLAHAYLFTGPVGIGKTATALAAAKFINCSQKSQTAQFFCNQCPSCRKIDAGRHPDVRMYESGEEDSIKIEQVREILDQVHLRPYEAQKKIFIIKNAESLTLEAANALLKTLEEPTASSMLILTTAVLEKNIDTIRSRCQFVRFVPHSKQNLLHYLSGHYREAKEQDLRFLACFARGCPGRAVQLKENHFLKQRDEVIDKFVLSSADASFVKTILQDKETSREFLDILLTWLHDAILLKAGAGEERLVHVDRLADLVQFTRRHSLEELKEIWDYLTAMFRSLTDNLNMKIPLTTLQLSFNG